MKIVNVFVHIFAVFSFLTVGSLMIIVSLHVLSMEDALLKVQYIYDDPWKSLQTGVTGILFIFVGIILSKSLVKLIRRDDEVVLYGKWGYMTVSLRAIDDLVKKVLQRFDVVKEVKTETEVEGNNLKIIAHLSVVSGWNLPELIDVIQNDISGRINKMLGGGIQLELAVNVTKIIEPSNSLNVKT